MPKGRLFPLTRDELVECAALLDASGAASSTALQHPAQPLDVLAQQIVADVAAREWSEDDALTPWCAAPGRTATLTREDFDAVVADAGGGLHDAPRPARRAPPSRRRERHRCAAGAARGSTAITSGGAIPDTADYQVVLEPENHDRSAPSTRTSRSRAWPATSSSSATRPTGSCGSSAARARRGRARAAADHSVLARRGARPQRRAVGAVSRLRAELGRAPAPRIRRAIGAALARRERGRPRRGGARQIVDYLAPRARRARRAADAGHDRHRALLRRGGRHAARHPLAVRQPHQPRLGAGAAQALLPHVQLRAAGGGDRGRDRAVAGRRAQLRRWTTSRAISHSTTVRDVLIQALLDAPLFAVRWRWNATRRSALPRFRGGKKVPPQLARMDAEDLLAVGLPRPGRLRREHGGEREIPDHPLVQQTIDDCLTRRWTSTAWSGCCGDRVRRDRRSSPAT